MHAGQPFYNRYPLAEIEGSCGNLMESGNYASPRYTGTRLSKLIEPLISSLNKNTIDDWRDNYDDTEKYPAVFPSLGFYNIVNGTQGISTGLASSIPQFNLREVNEALIKLLWNPDIDFDEIFCVPDFATGGVLLNLNEIKESLRTGHGRSCLLRSVVSYDKDNRVLTVSEIPYNVYTNTICRELEDIVNGDSNPGIERFNDLTGKTPNLKIYLSKGANADRVLKYLYKNTSLQSYYGINMTMLDNGKFPKVFGWKEALQAHLTHEETCYRRMYEFDLDKAMQRLHIVEGLIRAISIIEQVIEVIKKSASTVDAKSQLMDKFSFSDSQASAILEIKLARLAHLEIAKYEQEANKLRTLIAEIRDILADDTKLKQCIENGLRAVANEFGDERRTQVQNLSIDSDDEVEEKKTISYSVSNLGNIYLSEETTLANKVKKIKLAPNETIVDRFTNLDNRSLLEVTRDGRSRIVPLPLDSDCNPFSDDMVFFTTKPIVGKLTFVTKCGIIKVLKQNDITVRGKNVMDVADDDEIVSVLDGAPNSTIVIATRNGLAVRFNLDEINPQGNTGRGVLGIKLAENDYVVSATLCDSRTETLMVVSGQNAYRFSIDRLPLGSRGNKGVFVSFGNTSLVKSLTNSDKCGIIYTQKRTNEVYIIDVPLLERKSKGNKFLRDNEEAIGVIIK